jgi:hypothetical protein
MVSVPIFPYFPLGGKMTILYKYEKKRAKIIKAKKAIGFLSHSFNGIIVGTIMRNRQ